MLNYDKKLKHVLEAKQFSDRKLVEKIFKRADYMEKMLKGGKQKRIELLQILQGTVIASFFYEESTRTRLSFEAAAQRLGASTIGTEKASQFSSVAKGETLEDTIRILDGYVDAIVLRHNIEGSAKIAAQFSKVPIINAGDGKGEHPTQALLDIYTIKKEIGRIDDFSIAMVGDLKYGRTIHSLTYLLESHKDVKIYLVSPETLKIPDEHIQSLIASGTYFEETEKLEDVIGKVDVLYMTRIQKERFKKNKELYNKVKGYYTLNKEMLKKMKGDSAVIMHPLPRVGEIDPKVDVDPRAAYFRQAKNGLYIRMALLDMILG